LYLYLCLRLSLSYSLFLLGVMSVTCRFTLIVSAHLSLPPECVPSRPAAVQPRLVVRAGRSQATAAEGHLRADPCHSRSRYSSRSRTDRIRSISEKKRSLRTSYWFQAIVRVIHFYLFLDLFPFRLQSRTATNKVQHIVQICTSFVSRVVMEICPKP
jgi:hypothetical protein